MWKVSKCEAVSQESGEQRDNKKQFFSKVEISGASGYKQLLIQVKTNDADFRTGEHNNKKKRTNR